MFRPNVDVEIKGGQAILTSRGRAEFAVWRYTLGEAPGRCQKPSKSTSRNHQGDPVKSRLQVLLYWAAYRLGLRDTHGVKKIRIQLSIGDLFLVGVDQQGQEVILESTWFVPGIWPHLVRPYKSDLASTAQSQLQDPEHDSSMRRHMEVIGMGGKPASLCTYREIAPPAVPFIWEEKP